MPTSALVLSVRVSAISLALGAIICGCAPTPSDGPGPGGDVGPQSPIGLEEGIEGSGNVTTETRDVGVFDRLVFSSEGEVLVEQTGDGGLSITADDNLHQYIETRVDRGALVISTSPDADIAPTSPIEFRVDIGAFAGIEMRGVGAITAVALGGDTVAIAHSGVGDVLIDDLDADSISVDHGGVGLVRLAGRVGDQDVSVSGSGVYEAADLGSRVASVRASGLGEATVRVTDELSATAADSGVVRYYGTPTVDEQVSGAGMVVSMGGGEESAAETEYGREIRFTSAAFDLTADLHMPDAAGPHPAVIIVHGSGPQTRSSTPGTADIMRVFGDAGYAVFVWDKPGSGSSTGEFDQGHMLRQRAGILADAIEVLKEHPDIDNDQIGMWGLSQAGWVMPLALESTDDVAFMIVVSGGGEDSIEQLAYQLGQDRVCEGASEEVAAIVEEYFPPTAKGPTYGDYTAAMEMLVEVDGWEKFAGPAYRSEDEWRPWPTDIDAYFDPMTVMESTTIPVRAVFGDMDRYIDPIQGAAAYEEALALAGNTDYEVELLRGVGHTMLVQSSMCSTGGPTSDRYLELLEQWAEELAR